MAGNQPGRATTLTWGVKQSLRNYVEAAGGAIETAEGAERTADGGFLFPVAEGDGLELDGAGRPQGVARFLGEVRLTAHGGMLSIYLADPAVEISAARACISVADSAARDRRLDVAKLDIAAATTNAGGELTVPAVVSTDGWQVLGDHYPPGTPLDPVRLKIAGR